MQQPDGRLSVFVPQVAATAVVVNDTLGHRVDEVGIEGASLQLDLSRLTGGVYFVSLLSADRTIIDTQRVVLE